MDPHDREIPGNVYAVRDEGPPVSCDPPSLEETRRTVRQMKTRKTPGGCDIYAEMLRAKKSRRLSVLHILLCSTWNMGIIPIVPIWKEKGDTQECNNWTWVTPSLYQARSWHKFSIGSAKAAKSQVS